MNDMKKLFEKLSEQLLKVHHEMDLQLLGYRILFTIIEIKLFFLNTDSVKKWLWFWHTT